MLGVQLVHHLVKAVSVIGYRFNRWYQDCSTVALAMTSHIHAIEIEACTREHLSEVREAPGVV